MAVTTLAAMAAAGVWRGLPSAESTAAIDQARSLLRSGLAMPDASDRQNHARRAEPLLREHLRSRRRQLDSTRLLLVVALYMQGRPNEASAYLAQVHPQDAASADLALAAEVMFATRQFEQAERFIDAALGQDESQADVLRLAITLKTQRGEYDAAASHCRKLTELAPDDPFPWLKLAAIYEAQGYLELLVNVYDQIIELSPEYGSMARWGLVEILVATGDPERARREFTKLQQAGQPRIDTAVLIEAKLLHLEGQLADSLVLLRKHLRRDPLDPDAMQLQSQILVTQGQSEKAVSVLKSLIAVAPDNSAAHYLLSQAYGRLQQPDLAQRHLQHYHALVAPDSVAPAAADAQ